MAAELSEEYGADARLIKGQDGVFEVEVDGTLVFSKRKLGRFPDPGEVAKAIKAL
ncbi:MAG: SelT/SelW/SelH family protein [Candidatus Aminicenantes bacterium]|nr:MAG: SelT/SelW/SelH family protein [Candidatus Aminicenantes bacterium]